MTHQSDDTNGPPEADEPPPEFGSGELFSSEGMAGAEAPGDDKEHALDHALLRRAQAGEEAAFADLVRRHQARAWRVARNLVASDEDAQDLAQEAFVRVFKSLSTFDFQHGFTTWLYRIVTNLSIDHLRRRRPLTSTARSVEDEAEFDLVDENVAQPAAALESSEVAREVQACLAALAPHFQSVLVLREIEGLPCNEIAKIVGATHVTVRWRLHRGRKLFQEEWERRLRLREQGAEAGANDPPARSVLGDDPGGARPGPTPGGARHGNPAQGHAMPHGGSARPGPARGDPASTPWRGSEGSGRDGDARGGGAGEGRPGQRKRE